MKLDTLSSFSLERISQEKWKIFIPSKLDDHLRPVAIAYLSIRPVNLEILENDLFAEIHSSLSQDEFIIACIQQILDSLESQRICSLLKTTAATSSTESSVICPCAGVTQESLKIDLMAAYQKHKLENPQDPFQLTVQEMMLKTPMVDCFRCRRSWEKTYKDFAFSVLS